MLPRAPEASANSDQPLEVESQSEATTTAAVKSDVHTFKTLDPASSATIATQIENSPVAREIKMKTEKTAQFTALKTESTATVQQNSDVTTKTESAAVNEKITQNSTLATSTNVTSDKPQPATTQPPVKEIANVNAANVTTSGNLFCTKKLTLKNPSFCIVSAVITKTATTTLTSNSTTTKTSTTAITLASNSTTTINNTTSTTTTTAAPQCTLDFKCKKNALYLNADGVIDGKIDSTLRIKESKYLKFKYIFVACRHKICWGKSVQFVQ